MKNPLLILFVCVLVAAQPCLAQDDGGRKPAASEPAGHYTDGIPSGYGGTLRLPADTAFFPRLYYPIPYYMGDWQLHSGLNAQLGTSVTVGFGKHSPRGAGIGTHAAFLYAVPFGQRFSVAAGVGTETLDWGRMKIRNAELMGVAAYKVNDFVNVYAYGSKSLLDESQCRMSPYRSFGKERWGGAVDFSLGRNVFVQFGIEQARYY